MTRVLSCRYTVATGFRDPQDDVSAGGVSGFQLFMQINTGEPAVNATVGTNSEETLVGTSPLPITQWTHVVGVKNGTLLTLYVNNVPKNLVLSSATMDYTADDPETRIGQTSGGNGEFPGLIDDVRIYNRALSADEIKRLYNMGGTVKLNTTATSLQNGLVGWWTFDGKDLSGVQAYDRSGNGNRGILTSGPVQAIGKIGQGMAFDGVDDYVNAADPASLSLNTNFTISAWVNVSVFKDLSGVINKGDNGDASTIAIRADLTNCPGTGKGFTFRILDTSSNNAEDCIESSQTNTWHHVVMVVGSRCPQGLKGYEDGIGGSSVDTSGLGTITSTSNWLIGQNARGIVSFKGQIDDVRIYNRALSPDEIKRLYNMGGTVKLNSSQNLNNNNSLQNGLVGWWTFDGKDMAGNYAFDKSGNGNRGLLTGSNGLPVRTIGKIGQGMSFDGVDDYVDAGDPASLEPGGSMTVSLWFKLTSAAPEYTGPLMKSNAGNTGYGIFFTDDVVVGSTKSIAFFVTEYSQNAGYTAFDYTTDRNWHYAVGVYDGTNVQLYLDGAKGTDDPFTGAVTTDAHSLVIGSTDSSFNNPSSMPGLVDDVRIYNRALSADEIKRLYNMGR